MNFIVIIFITEEEEKKEEKKESSDEESDDDMGFGEEIFHFKYQNFALTCNYESTKM